MLYKYSEYSKYAFDTPALRMQEKIIVERIFKLLNSKKYESIDELKKAFPTYQDFLKENKLTTPIKMFGNTLKEEDFFKILDKISKLIKEKNSIDEEKIQEQNIEDNKFGIVQGEEKTYVLNNSVSSQDSLDRMKDLQGNFDKFKTSSPGENTEKVAQEMEKEKTANLNLRSLNEIKPDILNEQQFEYFNFAIELNNPNIKLDVDAGIIFDENQKKVFKIVKQDENFMLIGDNNEIVYSGEKEEEKKGTALQLSPNNSNQAKE